MNIFKKAKSFFGKLFKKRDKVEGENMAYGFYPNIPNNQVGVEINNGTIRIIQNSESNYSMKIDGMASLSLVNSKVIKHYTNMAQDPTNRDVHKRINVCIQSTNENINRFNGLGNVLYFWDFSIFNDSYFWSNRNNFKFYPNGIRSLYNPQIKSNNFRDDLPTIIFNISYNNGQYGSAGFIAGFNSSGLCVYFGMSNVHPQTEGILRNIVAIGCHVMFNMMKSLQVVQVYNDTSKPPYGLQVSNVYGEIYYPNSGSKLTNSGDYIIAPRNSNIDFNGKTVNGINYSNKKICFSDNVSSTIIVNL